MAEEGNKGNPEGGQVSTTTPASGVQGNSVENLEGLKRNRDELLQEKRAIAAELKALKDERAAQEAERLKKNGETDKLLAIRDKELADLKRENRLNRIRLALKGANVQDDDQAVILEAKVAADFSDLDVVIKDLVAKKPYLVGQQTAPAPGVGAHSPAGFTGSIAGFTRGQIKNMSPADYEKHRDAIQAALKDGKIK